MAKGDKSKSCAENGVYTPAFAKPPKTLNPLDFSAMDPAENARITKAGSMTFAMAGCSGDPDNQTQTHAVAAAAANGTSFFYHLGDITYTEKGEKNQFNLWNSEFYGPFVNYPKQIVAIAGNHDGKADDDEQKSQTLNFFANFCADPSKWPAPWEHNTTSKRPAMIQPHVYWQFDTPFAHFVGLYTNVANGGMLDNPEKHPQFTDGPQYKWLVKTLKALKGTKKAILLALHYPPYSGAANFDVRGDQGAGPTPGAGDAPFLAVALQQAFADAKQRPDAIFSAHAHLFQRITYTFADNTVMPCLVVGCGGHTPLEVLTTPCLDGDPAPAPVTPFPVVTPKKFKFPKGESAVVNAYEDGQTGGKFGYIQVTLAGRALTCTFMKVTPGAASTVGDTFTLDLNKRQYAATMKT